MLGLKGTKISEVVPTFQEFSLAAWVVAPDKGSKSRNKVRVFVQLPRKPVLPQGFESKVFIWEGIPRGNRSVTQGGKEASEGRAGSPAGYHGGHTGGSCGSYCGAGCAGEAGIEPSDGLRGTGVQAESSGHVGGHRQCLHGLEMAVQRRQQGN